jgi:DNA-binding transcriptional MerR regulator
METLRAWERRYGFPKPVRRAGSNRRLYSTADVERLAAIQRALRRGYRVGDVIHKTAEQLDELASTWIREVPTLEAAPLSNAPPIGALIDFLARYELTELEAQLRRFATALGPRRFVTDLAHPFVVKVGEGWEQGNLSVAHEHLATECLITQLRQMLASYQELDARPRVLLATLPGELHTLPLQMVALYLAAIGAKPRLLGGSTPLSEIVASAATLRADVVGVTVTATADGRQARKDLQELRRCLPMAAPLWVGGGGASELKLDENGILVLTSWGAIDEALAQLREGDRERASFR